MGSLEGSILEKYTTFEVDLGTSCIVLLSIWSLVVRLSATIPHKNVHSGRAQHFIVTIPFIKRMAADPPNS